MAADSSVWPDGNDESEANMISPFVRGLGRSMIVLNVTVSAEEPIAAIIITAASLNRQSNSMIPVADRATAVNAGVPPKSVTYRMISVSHPLRCATA